MAVMFSSALAQAASAARRVIEDSGTDVRLVRYATGQIAFAINQPRAEVPPDVVEFLRTELQRLGPYAWPGELIFADGDVDPIDFFANGWCETTVAKSDDEAPALIKVYLQDLPAWGRDWLWFEAPNVAHSWAKRIVFHGLKGGVGRSTAMAMLAFAMAKKGKKVLVIDLDLESPGVSGLLLGKDGVPAFGVIDWLVEDGVAQGQVVINDLIAESPLSVNEAGSILVVPAMGNLEAEYLAKLGRAYRDVTVGGVAQRFSDRLARLIETLEATYSPDLVLIDSRAGLHEVAAVSIARLADLSLLFAIDSPQTWSGYNQLFSHWRARPGVLRRVREKLLVVRALAGDGARDTFDSFLEKSFDLFSETLYDEVDPGAPGADVFSFDLGDNHAPHFPPLIIWDARFHEFNPLLPKERGGVSDAQIELSFGNFIARVVTAAGLEE